MLPPLRPALDPLAHRAAIQALEAQRAAYARFARTMDTHRTALGGGSGTAAVAAADAAARGYDELAEGARRLAPVVAAAHAEPAGRETLGRQLDAVMDEARAAEAAIQNLTTQLEAWRDAYGRQLAEVGLTPGAPGDGDAVGAASRGGAAGAPEGDEGRPAGGDGSDAARAGYGPRGRLASRAHPPSLVDRTG